MYMYKCLVTCTDQLECREMGIIFFCFWNYCATQSASVTDSKRFLCVHKLNLKFPHCRLHMYVCMYTCRCMAGPGLAINGNPFLIPARFLEFISPYRSNQLLFQNMSTTNMNQLKFNAALPPSPLLSLS